MAVPHLRRTDDPARRPLATLSILDAAAADVPAAELPLHKPEHARRLDPADHEVVVDASIARGEGAAKVGI